MPPGAPGPPGRIPIFSITHACASRLHRRSRPFPEVRRRRSDRRAVPRALLALERRFEQGGLFQSMLTERDGRLMLRPMIATGVVALLVAVSAAAAVRPPLSGTFKTVIKNAPDDQLDGTWQIALLPSGHYTIKRNSTVLIRGRDTERATTISFGHETGPAACTGALGSRHLPLDAPSRVAPPDNRSRRMPRPPCRADNPSAQEGRLIGPALIAP